MKLKVIYSLLALALASPAVDAVQKHSTPKDPALVNHERILYWLEKRGEIKPDATEVEKKLAIQQYLGKSLAHQPKAPSIVVNALKQKHQAFIKGVTTEQKTINNKTVNVLAVLIDFPDLPHDDNRLTSGDTEMYYSSYPVSHYQDLMFSPSGFAGPSGQTIESGYNFYQDESGGSFFFEGQTFGWVTADNDSDHYGENDPNSNDNDKNVPALVKEAVTKAVQEYGIDLAEYDIEDPYDLNGNGNLDEPDGLIDHVMIYHSSVGEEAGGGVLGDDAIWSHRFFVDGQQGGYTIPGTGKKLFGYTIQPIDAATGVVVHEFGHDLGLPDEYDIGGSEEGSPVGIWSVMASGTWVGSPAGTKPTGFSPYARSFLQASYGGDWIDELVVDFDDLMGTSQDVDLVEASDHSGTVNQIRVDLPDPLFDFMPPYTGSYQYYSGKGDMKSNSMSFNVDLPATGTLELSMKAHWDIEVDYDYLQVKANGTALAGNHTKVNNQYHNINNFITAKSIDINGAEGSEGWVDLTFDVTSYAGQTVTFSFNYETDQNTGGYGFIADDITIKQSGSTVYSDGAEDADVVTLNGFSRATNQAPGLPQNYWIQLRSANGRDAGFANTFNSMGVLVWFGNENYNDNKVGAAEDGGHPGYGFTGVVDADQNIIMNGSNPGSTLTQIRDAAFSIYNQKSTSNDNHLSAISVFDDSNDYSSPQQPESGLVLPEHGFKMEVINQAANSSTATVKLSAAALELTAGFEFQRNFREVTFTNETSGGVSAYSYEWDFGDGSALSTETNPVHTYAASGDYTVKLTVTDEESTVSEIEKLVTIGEELVVDFNETVDGNTVDLEATITGGIESFTVQWDLGDGNQETGLNSSYSYSLTGTYTITMTVISGDNQEAQASKQVSVVAPLNVNFTSTRNNLTASFSSTATGGDGSYTYSWNFGDGNSSTAQSPSHTYSAAGTYEVTFKATDGTGVEKEMTKSVTVSEPPSSGGGGGSTNWLLLLLLGLVLYRRR